jgi:DNA replication protein DnaC
MAMQRYHPDVAALEDAVFRFCQGIALNPNRGKRFVLYGNNGNGKSRSLRVVSRFIKDRGMELALENYQRGAVNYNVNCRLINWAKQLDEWRSSQEWSIEDLVEATVLLIDDIGAEHDPSKVGMEKLYLLLEEREWKWTMITTNKAPASWEQAFERRVSDRLFRNAEHVDLSRLPSFAMQ